MSQVNIKISVGEAYDRLSILEVKKLNSISPDQRGKIQEQILELQEQINNSITYDIAKKIYFSKEYTDLYNVNFKLFELVDKAKKNEVTAKEVDDEVFNRHRAKNNLQLKFFGNKTEEIKMGYN